MQDSWSCSWKIAVPHSLVGVARVLVQANQFVSLGSIPQPVAGGVCTAPEVADGMDLQAWRSLVVVQVWDSQIWGSGMHIPVQNDISNLSYFLLHWQMKLFTVTWVGERIYLTCETPEGLGVEEVQCSCLLIGPSIGKWFEERAIKCGWRAELEFCSRVLCSGVAKREGLWCR